MNMTMVELLLLFVDNLHILLVVVCSVVTLSIMYDSRIYLVHVVSARKVLLLAVFSNLQQLIFHRPIGS